MTPIGDAGKPIRSPVFAQYSTWESKSTTAIGVKMSQTWFLRVSLVFTCLPFLVCLSCCFLRPSPENFPTCPHGHKSSTPWRLKIYRSTPQGGPRPLSSPTDDQINGHTSQKLPRDENRTRAPSAPSPPTLRHPHPVTKPSPLKLPFRVG